MSTIVLEGNLTIEPCWDEKGDNVYILIEQMDLAELIRKHLNAPLHQSSEHGNVKVILVYGIHEEDR